jgi:HAD superfamily hydrolase (TIGR01549 family)
MSKWISLSSKIVNFKQGRGAKSTQGTSSKAGNINYRGYEFRQFEPKATDRDGRAASNIRSGRVALQCRGGGRSMKYDAIFFDWDGVITDSVNIKTDAFAKMFRKYGEDIERRVVEYHLQHGGLSRFEKFKYFYKVYLNEEINDVELASLGEEFSKMVFDSVVASDYVEGVLQTLKSEHAKGTLLFVVSGTPTREIRLIAETKGIARYFSGIYGSPDAKTEIIGRLIEENALRKDTCLMFGDALEDYRAAENNNIMFIGISRQDGASSAGFPLGTKIQCEVGL